MSDLGIAALEDRERVDFRALRSQRLERALREMALADLDALLLGREANARYVSGARRLWTVGTRGFAPTCVVLRESHAVHLLSTWDDGIPAEIPRSHLYQTSWNPENLLASLTRIPGLGEARRIGIDGMSPLFAKLLPAAFPAAEWLDATMVLQRARARKSKDELVCLRTAVAIAEGAWRAISAELRPGAGERNLTGRFHAEATRLGTPIPAFEASFCGSGEPGSRHVSGARQFADGELVACHAGVLYAGYEGTTGHTVLCSERAASSTQLDLAHRLDRLMQALRGACRPGAKLSAFGEAYAACGEEMPGFPIVHGVGLGVEPPIAGVGGDPEPALLESGSVIAILGQIRGPEGECAFAQDTLSLTQDGCESLCSLPHHDLQ